jgi:DNA mismatch endonuclease (patch repair protein)
MADKITPEERSRVMAQVRNRDTTPEKRVRSWLHHNGYRFRLYRNNLPGCPDIVLPKYKTVIFVHGCFWHRHEGCKRASMPENHKDYWRAKFERNVVRDKRVQQELKEKGWRAVVVWECETRNASVLEEKFTAVNLRNRVADMHNM